MSNAAHADAAADFLDAGIAAGSTTRNAVIANEGTAAAEAVLFESAPWAQCFKQSSAAAFSIMPAQWSEDALVLAAGTRPPNASNCTLQACAATAPCANRSTKAVRTAIQQREVRRIPPLKHTDRRYGVALGRNVSASNGDSERPRQLSADPRQNIPDFFQSPPIRGLRATAHSNIPVVP